MHDRFDLVTLEGVEQERAVADIAFDERPPLDCPMIAVNQIIIGHRTIAGAGEGFGGMAADIAGTTGDQDVSHEATCSALKPEGVPAGPITMGHGRFFPTSSRPPRDFPAAPP